jgi:predicted DNA-binding transcriptional regulator YafY
MGKVGNALKMFQLLRNGKKYSIRELSDILEVSPRMIRVYKNELEKAGFYLESLRGKYGGYLYNVNEKSLQLDFSIYDLHILEQIYQFLLNSGQKEKAHKIEQVTQKIRILALYNKTEHDYKAIDYEKQKEYINKISEAIKNQKNLDITYKKQGKTLKVRKVVPYFIYKYNNTYFLTGLCKEINDIRTYSFLEIKTLT